MEFSKKSWHYRLVRYIYSDMYFITFDLDRHRIVQKNISLCKYFWSVVLACVLMAFWIPIKYLFVKPVEYISKHMSESDRDFKWPEVSNKTRENIGKGLLIGALVVGVSVLIYSLILDFWTTIIVLIILAVSCGIIIGTGLGFTSLIDYTKRRKFEKRVRERDEVKVKNPHMLVEYIKSNKEKICPILKFRDDDVLESFK